MRDSHPASCRGGDAGQTFSRSATEAELRDHDPYDQLGSARHVGPIPAHILQQIFDEDQAFNRRVVADFPKWREAIVPVILGTAAALIVAAVIAYLQSRGTIAQ